MVVGVDFGYCTFGHRRCIFVHLHCISVCNCCVGGGGYVQHHDEVGAVVVADENDEEALDIDRRTRVRDNHCDEAGHQQHDDRVRGRWLEEEDDLAHCDS